MKKSDKLAHLLRLADECNKALKADGKVYLGSDHEEVERIPTGVLCLDLLTGGGIPRARATELHGEESAGKTLLALLTVASIQRKGFTAVWIKGEDFDRAWAKRLGVDLGKLVMVEASVGDKACETAVSLIEEGDPDLLVLDSIQSLGTEREANDGVDAESYAGAGSPQMWGRVMRRLYAAWNGKRSKTAAIWISQVRDPIGAFSPGGKPEAKPTQIRALRHGKSLSIQCKKGEPTFLDPKSDKRRVLSREFHLKCTKNKTAGTEGQKAAFTFNFMGDDFGIDRVDEVIRMGKACEFIQQKGGWLYLPDYSIKAQGEEALREKLAKKPSVVTALTTDILEQMRK